MNLLIAKQTYTTLSKILLLIILFTSIPCYSAPVTSNIEETVLAWVKGGKDVHFIGEGSLGGCFTDKEFWKIYRRLHHEYPKKVGDLIRFGETIEKRHIHGFFLQSNEGKI